MMRIGLIEDDRNICSALEEWLTAADYEVISCDNLASAQWILGDIDLLLLDVNLPDGNGYAFLESLSGKTFPPTIFLTVRDDEADILRGFAAGAVDYVTKPFSGAVLLARIRAALKDYRRFGNMPLQHNKKRKEITLQQHPLSLTPLEYRLLVLLLDHCGQTLTRNQLLARLWDDRGYFVNDNTLSVTIRRLREKIGNEVQITTVRGIGYRLEEMP